MPLIIGDELVLMSSLVTLSRPLMLQGRVPVMQSFGGFISQIEYSKVLITETSKVLGLGSVISVAWKVYAR